MSTGRPRSVGPETNDKANQKKGAYVYGMKKPSLEFTTLPLADFAFENNTGSVFWLARSLLDLDVLCFMYVCMYSSVY